MKFKITLLLALVASAFSTVTYAQDRTIFGEPLKSINRETGIVRCVSSEYEEYLRNKFGRETEAQFEAWMAEKLEERKRNRQAAPPGTTVVLNIPVVVHVIHNGSNVGSTANISDLRVQSQITVLNQDFRKMLGTPGYNTNAVGADVEIEFCLAQRKPDGTATTGIDRINYGVASWSSESSVEAMKTATSWDPTQYFNIWTIAVANSGDLNGILGYAQFPNSSTLAGVNASNGAASTDGVVINWRCFGTNDIAPAGGYLTPYVKGRTATHEIGHCFGLRHIWGDNSSCTVNTTDSFNDYCPDTPAASQENYDCTFAYNSCPTAPGNDMTENYMDYTNDACMNIFTQNQKDRVLIVMENSPRRSTLPASLGCQPPLSVPTNVLDELRLYPNPANEFVMLNVDESFGLPDSYTLLNALGQIVSSKKISSSADLQISTSQISSGVYFLKVSKGTGEKTLRFLKK